MRFFFVSCFIIFYGLFPISARAGAWLQNKDDTYLAINTGFFTTDHFYNIDGSWQQQRRFTKAETNLYIEHGLYDWLTIGGNFFVTRAQQGGIHNAGIADPELFIRLPIVDYRGWVASVQPLIKLPSQYENGNVPRAGSQSTDAELSLLLGHNSPILSPLDYMEIRLAYRERSRNLEAQYKFDISYGIHWGDFIIAPAYRVTLAKNIDPLTPFREDGEQDYDLQKIELGLHYRLNAEKTLLLNMFKHYAGANAGAGQGLSLGVAWQF